MRLTYVWTNTNAEFDSVKQITQIESYYKAVGRTIRQMKFIDGGYTIWETPRDTKFFRAKINSRDPKVKNNLIIAAESYDAALIATETFGETKFVSNYELIFMGSIK